ncbi:class I SAM-dependent methyltransferase [Candidatus Micrarchaeota archaeon]|nr:class I SAM-dependent methyltransferase [Candidatus Micrarchaeota archaeon]
MKNLLLRMGFLGFDLTIRKRVTFLKSIRNSNVLDVGCGRGYISYLLSKKSNEVLGVDHDEAAINSAISRYGDSAKFRVMKIGELCKLNERFDCVVCMEVIEHIKDDAKLLRDMRSVLKEGGLLTLSTINSECYLNSISTPKISKVEDGGDVRAGYTKEELARNLAAAGFEDVKISSCIGRITQRALSIEYSLRSIKAISYNQIYRAFIFALLCPISLLDNSHNKNDDMTLVVFARKGGLRE